MKRIFILLTCVVMSLSAMSATVFTFPDQTSENQTKDGITVTIARGSGNNAPVFNDNYGEFRLYANNTITVSGASITRVSLTFSMQGTKPYATLTANTGTFIPGGNSVGREDLKVDVWTGDTGSVTFTMGSSGQRIIHQIVVNGDADDDEIPTVPGNPDVPSILDPDYVYPAVTSVSVPSQTVQGDAYSFVDNNIQVYCTKGAVTADYFSAHAGFAMTFTATQPIKGIVVDGFVKKDFTATVSDGEISYLTPTEDQNADPVLVVKGADSKSITISCVKQLRCYSVEVFFEYDPDVTVSGGSGEPDEEVDLDFDYADCIYETEYSEMIGEPNYSIFLYRENEPEVYFSLDIYPVAKGDVTGKYSWYDYSLGDYTYYSWGLGDDDIAWAIDGEVTITKTDNEYTVKGVITADNNKVYNIRFSGEMFFYTDDEYYGGDSGGDSGIKDNLEEGTISDDEAPKYDITGRKVSEGYRGFYIKNGRKYIGQ